MNPAWPRIAYAAEFLLALIAVFTLWSQVGGQGHLDLMPWYWKLGPAMVMAVAIVGTTASAASQEKWLNARSVAWFMLAAMMAGAMAMLTYYYHLQEGTESGPEQSVATAITGLNRRRGR